MALSHSVGGRGVLGDECLLRQLEVPLQSYPICLVFLVLVRNVHRQSFPIILELSLRLGPLLLETPKQIQMRGRPGMARGARLRVARGPILGLAGLAAVATRNAGARGEWAVGGVGHGTANVARSPKFTSYSTQFSHEQ